MGTITHICVPIGTSVSTNWEKAAMYPARDFGFIAAIRNAFTYSVLCETMLFFRGRPACIQFRTPSQIKNTTPLQRRISNSNGDVKINADTPTAESPRNKHACVRIPRTQIRLLRNPISMAVWMQFTAFGPGVVTNSTQNVANMNHPSMLI